MPDVHARFSPSASDRLIHCPPSLLLGEEVGPEDTSSDYTREGTEAHSLGEFLLRTALGEQMEDPRPGFHYYNEEMFFIPYNVTVPTRSYPSNSGSPLRSTWRIPLERPMP